MKHDRWIIYEKQKTKEKQHIHAWVSAIRKKDESKKYETKIISVIYSTLHIYLH